MATSSISYLTQEQVQALLASIHSIRDKAIFTVAYWRGLRASEVGLLRMDDYRPDAKRLFVRRVKGGVSAEYVLHPAEVQALNNWLKIRGPDPGPIFVARGSAPISRQRLHNLMVNHSVQLGFPADRRHFHCLRHSIATHLVSQSMDIMMIRDWLGHRDIASTMVYAKVLNPARDAASERLYRGMSQEAPGEAGDGTVWVGKAGGQKPPGRAGSAQPAPAVVPDRVHVKWGQDRKSKRA